MAEVGHPHVGLRGRHLETSAPTTTRCPSGALEFLASPRGSRILRDIAAGNHEGNISHNQFHPLALDQGGQEPEGPEASA